MLALGIAWAVWVNQPSPTLVTSVPPPRRPAAGELPWVSTVNYRIVDEQGRYLLLRGFNQDSLLNWPSWTPAPLDETDAQLMQAAGFDVVRLPLDWSQIEPRRGEINTAYIDRVERVVRMLNQHHLYVVFDMHFSLDWGPRFGGTSAPEWAYIPWVWNGTWQPPNASWKISPGIYAAHNYFWMEQDWQRDFHLAWRAVAERFRDWSGVVGYDLYNEPAPFPLPPHIFERQWMWPLFADTIDQIGEVDPNHLYMVEGILLWDFPTTMDHVLAPNLVFAPHVYTGALVPPDYPVAPDRLPRSVQQMDWEAKQLPAATWIGELGIDFSKSYADQWMGAVLDSMDELKLGWAWWEWRGIPTWGVRNTEGTQVNEHVLRLLARPYVQAAPPGVMATGADGVQGYLTIEVDSRHVDEPVVVAWPGSTLGSPALDGSCVQSWTWDAGRARVDVTLAPGSGCNVRLTAANLPAAP